MVAANDAGRRARFEILRRDVERKMLEPLRLHGWKADIDSEGVLGEYVAVTADRGDHRHRVAVLYSSATDNKVYKALAQSFEHIYFNGAPYQVESFAYGIDVPVGPIDSFAMQLHAWNAASAVGKFAGVDKPPEKTEPSRRQARLLLSENPIDAVWLRLRQLHSVTLARKALEERARREHVDLSADSMRLKAEGVAYSLRNATDYFRMAEHASVSQRVLNLYYGCLSFAFAEILASPSGASTLTDMEASTKQGHGLYAIDGEDDGLNNLIVGVISRGFFPLWMKAMGMPTGEIPDKKPAKFDDVGKLSLSSWVTLESLFASIPEVGDLFADIFDGKPRWIVPNYDQIANLSAPGAGSPNLPKRAYAKFIDEFGRLAKEDIAAFPGPISEIAEIDSEGDGRHFRAVVDYGGHKIWWDALSLHHSPFKRVAMIMPVLGGVDQFRAICFVLLYALSIIVRYRPGTWRRVQEGDLDHLRALIEAFLAVAERILPEQFLEKITGQAVFAKQPGAF